MGTVKKIPSARVFASSKAEADRMIEFAKLHVNAALEAAAENAEMTGIAYGNDTAITDYMVDKQSILKAYPEENIK